MPSRYALTEIMERVSGKTVEAYVDTVSDEPLVSSVPAGSTIKSERTIESIGVTEWKLGNGITVVMKPTDFKNDEILFTAYSPGGNSLVSDEDYIPAVTATSIIEESGIGTFGLTELQKKLTGKIVSVSPFIGRLREGFSGSASPADVETMFQLIYLYATAPRQDSEAFQSFRTRIEGFIENRSARPETAFYDTLSVTLSQHHHRARPWTMALLGEMDLDSSLRIYRERFADTDDFTFFFVGAFDPEAIRPLVQTYLGGLPVNPATETWRDDGVEFPEGIIKREVRRGIEPKSRVTIVYTGPFTWGRRERYELDSMTDVLRIKLREVLREDSGGTYGVGVSQSVSHYPDEMYEISISFGTAPEKVDEMTQLVYEQIDSLKTVGVTEEYLVKVKETQRREREINLKENSFWLGILDSYYFNGDDPAGILKYGELVDGLTLDAIQQAAQAYFNENNYVKVVLNPVTGN